MTPQFDEATRSQTEAANPAVSAWVTANAGTGKTRVLTNRVARLLVDGVAPERILCITYTNAAANEMSHRLMEIFSRWTMLPDDSLRNEIIQIGVNPATITSSTLNLCRTLMAHLADPGSGLNLSTVHAFAATLLRRFPLEAGVSPRFSVVDDRERVDLLTTILSDLADENPAVFADICNFTSQRTFEVLALGIVQNAHVFARPPSRQFRAILRQHDGSDSLEANPDDCQQVRDLVKDYNNWNSLFLQQALQDPDVALLKVFGAHLERGGSADRKRADKIAAALAEEAIERTFEKVCGIFLDSRNQIRSNFANKATLEALDEPFQQQLQAYAHRLVSLKTRQSAGTIAARTVSCHRFAETLLHGLKRYQAAHGSLFYDDLLVHLHGMLANQQVADWVLYRLDASIDHILVDEAQDMNDRNWDIVNQLAEEFTAGTGQHEGGPRTIFAVGDSKQSIFGFQGANPKRFMDMDDHYRQRHEEAEQPFLRCKLSRSFRSSQAVLDVVDATLGTFPSEGLARPVPHKAFHENLPGRVDLLDFQEPAGEPHDHVGDYARQIITVIRKVLDSAIPTRDGPRQAKPGDILILVQTRSSLYTALTRELHRSKIPYSGADRLNLADQIAVKDLMALLAWLACGEDDLSLACVLRSPLCDVSEEDLFDLAYGRTGTLGQELMERAGEKDCFRCAADLLTDLLTMKDGHKPYDVIERVLTIHDGMKRWRARLGAQATEAIEILLDQALQYEQSHESSLTGFVEWLDPQTIDVARKMSQQSNAVKVMTVHGAKGLEAPVVILPETAHKSVPMPGGLYFDPDGLPIWLEKEMLSNPEHQAIWHHKEASLDEEKLCLMYVAMTRAQCWLIIGGVGKKTTKAGSRAQGRQWYCSIEQAMHSLQTTTVTYIAQSKGAGSLEARRYESGTWPDPGSLTETGVLKTTPAPRPDWLMTPLPPPEKPGRPIIPSQLGDAAPAPPEASPCQGQKAARRGTLVHLLLECLPDLPRANWQDLAVRIVRSEEPDLDAEAIADITETCLTLLGMPKFAGIFGPDALSEVPVTARLPQLGSASIYGIIDKLVVLDDKVLAVDFKSHSSPPAFSEDIPMGILQQMGVYRWALERIYPDHEVEIAILWTTTCQLMTVPRTVAEEALEALIDE